MASIEGSPSTTSFCSQSLPTKLATILPKNSEFKIYHLSTPPTKTSSLYSAPPDSRPDRTYCESHFLVVSIRAPSKDDLDPKDVLVFAIEILIYSTAHDTTFFVSKADSTGFLHLLGLPKGTPSPVRSISAAFLQHLLEQHQRPNLRNIVSLFARAQDQYLFPGSVEYNGKHVLDDRGLVRWWCRVLDPLIEDSKSRSDSSAWESIKGYLIVPGLDAYETSSYPPKKAGTTGSWTVGHPLKKISRHGEDVPPRCLIPHYPDDPKARYLDELDEEITKSKGVTSGQWKSVNSIDQFWEMMAFRQECSAGRLVGFIWIVFEPNPQLPTNSFASASQSTAVSGNSRSWDGGSSFTREPPLNDSPATSFYVSSQLDPNRPPVKSLSVQLLDPDRLPTSPNKTKLRKKKLTGPIIPRLPRIKTENKSHIHSLPEISPYYLWRPSGRGQIVVEDTDYKRITELLLRLDFANLELASSSTKRWVSEVKAGASSGEGERWGETVVGTRVIELRSQDAVAGVKTLNVGLVRKKRKPEEEVKDTQTAPVISPVVNVLSAGMIRKKPKT